MLAYQVQPINLTFPSLIKAACSSFSVSYGVALHGQALKRGVVWDPYVQTSFVRLYGEVGDLRSSRKMFDEIVEPCVIACNSMLDACGRNGEMDSAFELFCRMPVTDVVSWTTVINGFGKNGLHAKAVMLFGEMIENKPKKALEMFEMMKSKNVHPNGITLLVVLTACARSKLVDLGIQLFTSICSEYKIIPTSEHYGCMVDLIGRAGLLVDAVNFIKGLPFEPDASVFGTLLGACKIHENAELGNKVGKQLIGLQPQHCGQYVALSTLNALDSNWSEAEQMRKIMIQAGIRKRPGYSVLFYSVRRQELLCNLCSGQYMLCQAGNVI